MIPAILLFTACFADSPLQCKEVILREYGGTPITDVSCMSVAQPAIAEWLGDNRAWRWKTEEMKQGWRCIPANREKRQI